MSLLSSPQKDEGRVDSWQSFLTAPVRISKKRGQFTHEYDKGWDDLDIDACMAQVTDDMCYLNQPLEAIRGRANVRKMLASIFAEGKRAEFKLLNVFGTGNKVITERLDQWDWDGSGTWQLKLPVCGMFELTDDGKIYEWREYYDNEHWSKNGGPSLVL